MHSFEGFGLMSIETSSELDGATPQAVLEQDNLTISSVAVPHGEMPTVAYRISCDGRTVVLSGDVQTAYPPLVELAQGCDLLVHELALPERETENGHLFAKPIQVGEVARDCGCARLLLTHVMPDLEDELEDAIAQVRRAYAGELMVAEDLMRLEV